MTGKTLRFCCCFGVVFAVLCMLFTIAFAQTSPVQGQKLSGAKTDVFNQVVKALPPGGPAPRMADGHVDFTGSYYPNSAGRILDTATPGYVDRAAKQQFDPKVTPQERIVLKPGRPAKYKIPYTYGICDQAGTPTSITNTQNAPIELIQTPERLVVLAEYPLDVRMIYMNRPHPKDPDPTFNGDSSAHWEGDTLIVDVIAIDDRLRNIILDARGVGDEDFGRWLPSDREHVIERFSRPSKNYLVYQVTIEDPVVLAKPWTSAPHKWSLAQDPNDEWAEVFCTSNEEPGEYKSIQENGAKAKGK
jgi:hypothetical protein